EPPPAGLRTAGLAGPVDLEVAGEPAVVAPVEAHGVARPTGCGRVAEDARVELRPARELQAQRLEAFPHLVDEQRGLPEPAHARARRRGGEHAPLDRVARAGGADGPGVAVQRCAGSAGTGPVARLAAVAHGVVVAGRPGRLVLAARRAAVASVPVPVVALLTGIEDAVAARMRITV